MSFFLHGVHVPHRKNTADKPAARMGDVKTVRIPMLMHIGSPAAPTVKVGDSVKVGDLIAQSTGAISVPIHASISGKITAISDMLTSRGDTVPAISIESDGEMAISDSVSAPPITSRDDLIKAIHDSGVVGLGGAGFPTHVKWRVDPDKIEELVINGAECEPYITSDSLTMTERADDMEVALKALTEHFGLKRS